MYASILYVYVYAYCTCTNYSIDVYRLQCGCSTRALLHSWSDSLCLFRFSVSIPLYIGFIQYERILIISARDQVHGTFVSLTNSYFNWYTYKIRVQPTVRVHVRVRGLSVRVQYVYAPVLFVYVYVYAKSCANMYAYT